MDIKINGKEYRFNPDVRLGILELAENVEKIHMKQIKMILKEILRPSPNAKEYFNIKKSQLIEIMEQYGEFMEQESSEIKKKRSH
ncbi:hypothetical protein LCGC14_0956530 [marine sediment metagenome]|uniref:Uncharacterized protein n=1 Tax=marine sediment metagenome TaxID=412755 RepID=A0A0F9QZ23_9ZZZZ